MRFARIARMAGGAASPKSPTYPYPAMKRSHALLATAFGTSAWFWIMWRYYHDGDHLKVPSSLLSSVALPLHSSEDED